MLLDLPGASDHAAELRRRAAEAGYRLGDPGICRKIGQHVRFAGLTGILERSLNTEKCLPWR